MLSLNFPVLSLLALAMTLFPCTYTSASDVVFPGETWEVVAPEEMLVDSQLLEEAMALLPDSSRTMVLRNGRVIWQGSSVDSPTEVASITKAFASTALGLLIDDGVLTLDTPVADYNPALAQLYADVSFRHLTTQTSNVRGNVLAPSSPYFVPSGSRFYYNTTSGNNALSHGLQLAAGQTLEEFLTDRIGGPIGMDTTHFDFSQTNLQAGGGELVTINTAHIGLQTTANNIARFGLLFMNGGEWDGERILSEDWVEQATSVQVGSEVPVHAGFDFTGIYGMGGWARFDADSFNSYGSGNSRLFVDPVAGFVVASLRNEGGATTHAASNAMISALYNSQIPVAHEPGDFDGDGDIDGRDFLAWQRGESRNPLSESDLLNWELGYETLNGNLAARNSAVPEPSTMLLCLQMLSLSYFRSLQMHESCIRLSKSALVGTARTEKGVDNAT